MDFIETRHTCAKNCLLLTALLSSHLEQFCKGLFKFQNGKMTKNGKKCGNNAIETFTILVVPMMISLLLKTVSLIKIGAVSSKFCLVSCGVILFVVSLILFEKIEFS